MGAEVLGPEAVVEVIKLVVDFAFCHLTYCLGAGRCNPS